MNGGVGGGEGQVFYFYWGRRRAAVGWPATEDRDRSCASQGCTDSNPRRGVRAFDVGCLVCFALYIHPIEQHTLGHTNRTSDQWLLYTKIALTVISSPAFFIFIPLCSSGIVGVQI